MSIQQALPTDRKNFNLQKWVLAIGALLMVGKFVAYFITHSNTILTDALESIVNIVAGIMGMYSLYLAAKPSDKEHPYGHGKIEFISASVEGTLILATGIMMVVKSTAGFFSPIAIHSLDVGLYIITAAGLLNYILGWKLEKQGKQTNSMTLIASGKHLKTDAYTTIGILIGLAIIFATGQLWLDNTIAIALGLYIAYNGISILRSSIAGIMDEADRDLLVNIIKILNENRRPNLIDVHNMRIIKYGSKLHIDCHVTLPWYFNLNEAHKEIEEIDNLINKHYPQGVEFFIHTDGCIPSSCRICPKTDCEVRQHAFDKRNEWTLENVMQNKKHGL